MLSEEDLVGAWRLVSHYYLDGDGSTDEGPLGAQADGLLIYDPRGYLSVALMRTGGSDPDLPKAAFMGYAGRWRLDTDVVIHDVEVSSHARIVKTAQVREVRLDPDGLTLRERIDDTPRYLVLHWRPA